MFYGSLLELSCIEICKMEADLELSIMELYYNAKLCIRKYNKGSVCENVAVLGLKCKKICEIKTDNKIPLFW
jgi:hypothetical protein